MGSHVLPRAGQAPSAEMRRPVRAARWWLPYRHTRDRTAQRHGGRVVPTVVGPRLLGPLGEGFRGVPAVAASNGLGLALPGSWVNCFLPCSSRSRSSPRRRVACLSGECGL